VSVAEASPVGGGNTSTESGEGRQASGVPVWALKKKEIRY